MTRTSRSALMLLASLIVVALLAAPSVSAALTITQVEVVVGGVSYCDTTTSCANQIWTIPAGGVNLATGETLILTQTGGQFSFDTSDRDGSGPACGITPCPVKISINSGAGLTLVYDNSAGNPDALNAGNADPGNSDFNEAAAFVNMFTGSAFTLEIGYADNTHLNACTGGAGGGCFPQATWGPAGATVFLGAPVAQPFLACDGTTHPLSADGGCYDAGALRITATAPPPSACPLTQGFWKNHPNAWPVTTLTIGGISYTEAQLLTVLNTPPQGDAVLILADQLIAALLNIANGSDPTPIASTMADAQSLLAGINLLSHASVKTSSTLGQHMVADATLLDSYNNGALTPTCIGPS